MFFIYLMLFIIVITILSHYQNKKALDMMKNVPGPLVFPFIGNAHSVIGSGSTDIFKALELVWNDFGVRTRAFIGPKLILFLSSAKDAETLLNSQEFIEKADEYDFLHSWLGTGLLTSKGDKWRKHRKIITPAFHFRILESFIQVFNDQSGYLLKKFRNNAGNTQFNVYPLIALYALDVICETAMGVSINAQGDSESEYVKAVKAQCEVIMDRVKNPFKRLSFIFRLTQDYKKEKKSLGILHGFTNKMIQERRQLLQNRKETMSSYIDEDDTGTKKKKAFLDMLLLSTIDGQPLDDVSIREEVDTFLFEGHDTTTSALSFTMYLISRYPEVQAKILEEQKDIFGDDKLKYCSYEDLQRMKYLEMAIKEALRLYPSVPLLARKIDKDTNLNDIRIPAGTTVTLLVYQLNRNPDVFEKPESFIPERFSVEESSKRSPYSSLPFSAGSRNCIGQKFAMYEMKTNLSMVIRNFELFPGDTEVDLQTDLILKSSTGVHIKVQQRTS